MVAYSFQARFALHIEQRLKLQTIRLPRRRHARPGERVQLFQGMRTRSCRKIIPDPVCIGIDQIVVDTRSGRLDHLEINGTVLDLTSADADAFARADGFGRPLAGPRPIEIFGAWWSRGAGRALHEDLVLIRWEDRP